MGNDAVSLTERTVILKSPALARMIAAVGSGKQASHVLQGAIAAADEAAGRPLSTPALNPAVDEARRRVAGNEVKWATKTSPEETAKLRNWGIAGSL